MNWWIKEWITERINDYMVEVDGLMNEWINERMNKWKDDCVSKWMNKWLNYTDEYMVNEQFN